MSVAVTKPATAATATTTATVTTSTTATTTAATTNTTAAAGGGPFADAEKLAATVRKMFCNASATTLRHLLEAMPEWSADDVVKQNVLQSLENAFACGYEETRHAEAFQFLLPTLNQVFSCETMLAAIDTDYVLNSLNRGACSWNAHQDAYVIDAAVNVNAMAAVRVFLEFFLESPCPKQRRALQTDIVQQLRDAALVGNWLFFSTLYDYSSPMDVAERCIEECCHMQSCEARQAWIDEHWTVAEKKRKI